VILTLDRLYSWIEHSIWKEMMKEGGFPRTLVLPVVDLGVDNDDAYVAELLQCPQDIILVYLEE